MKKSLARRVEELEEVLDGDLQKIINLLANQLAEHDQMLKVLNMLCDVKVVQVPEGADVQSFADGMAAADGFDPSSKIVVDPADKKKVHTGDPKKAAAFETVLAKTSKEGIEDLLKHVQPKCRRTI
jgi:hypothetical protein